MSIRIAAYDAAWARQFEAERTLLERVLEPWLRGGVHHIGSTAVPGLASKPVLDILAGVRDLAESRAAFEALRCESYRYEPHRPGIAHHFVKTSLGVATHGLHLTEPGSDLWRERLAFRDALRADPTLAAEYETLKLRLVQEHRDDMQAYTAGKRAFVASVLASAGLELGAR